MTRRAHPLAMPTSLSLALLLTSAAATSRSSTLKSRRALVAREGMNRSLYVTRLFGELVSQGLAPAPVPPLPMLYCFRGEPMGVRGSAWGWANDVEGADAWLLLGSHAGAAPVPPWLLGCDAAGGRPEGPGWLGPSRSMPSMAAL